MKKILNEKQELVAYILHTDKDVNQQGNITQKKIADLLGVSQPTISQAINSVKTKLQIMSLRNELSTIKKELFNGEIIDSDKVQTLRLPANVSNVYHRKP